MFGTLYLRVWRSMSTNLLQLCRPFVPRLRQDQTLAIWLWGDLLDNLLRPWNVEETDKDKLLRYEKESQEQEQFVDETGGLE